MVYMYTYVYIFHNLFKAGGVYSRQVDGGIPLIMKDHPLISIRRGEGIFI